MKEHDWCYRLWVPRKLYLALIKMQAEKGLTKSKTGLLCLAKGANEYGFLTNGDFEVLEAKYSISLEEEANAPTPEQIRQRETKANRDRQLNRDYKEVLEQWDTLKDESKQYHFRKSEVDKHLKYARLVLEKYSQEAEEKK